MDTPNAQYRHGYTYCTVSSWIHIVQSIIVDMNTAVPLSLGETFSLTILVELQVMAPLSEEGLVLAQCSLLEVEYKRLMAVLTHDLVNTSQTLRTTSRGVLPALFPGHSQILTCSFTIAAR